jgi:pimeloyl-ACP methyl ester carboxylesterase
MANFVLVHGAWQTASTWDLVTPKLQASGHQVWTPLLSGLENDAPSLTPEINLQTHVDDIINFLTHKNLQDVTLVGHSYAGMIITAVAENAAPRLNRLVYVDAFVPNDGQSALDLLPGAVVQSFRQQAEIAGEGWRLPAGEGHLDMWA